MANPHLDRLVIFTIPLYKNAIKAMISSTRDLAVPLRKYRFGAPSSRNHTSPRADIDAYECGGQRRQQCDQLGSRYRFGRVNILWGRTPSLFCWTYNAMFKTCVALTNVHIHHNPLRRSDRDFYKHCVGRMMSLAAASRLRRQQSHKSSLARQRSHLDREMRTVLPIGNEDEEEPYHTMRQPITTRNNRFVF
ncbi:TPA: hypothetical protein N0F65_001572, partial [Lagenidium giganteum]